MSYIMATADFPGVTTSERNKVYDCLKEKKWQKVTEPGRDIDTDWYAKFQEDIGEKILLQKP